ncbi:MAG: hypothetical protein IT173_12545 [Acidobacteria bacterium]|nr:hypothetical protein [Acidobacteriota bacterium]
MSDEAIIHEREIVQIVTIGIQGPAGAPGTPGNGVQVIGEVPTGAINGSNAIFTTAFPFVPESVGLTVNGLRQKKVDDFNTSGNQTLTLAVSPETGTNMLVDYLRA